MHLAIRNLRAVLVVSIVSVVFAACAQQSDPSDTGETEKTTSGLYFLGTTWTGGVVNVCYEPTNGNNSTLLARARSLVANSWSIAANITFPGWAACSTTPTSTPKTFARLSFQPGIRSSTSTPLGPHPATYNASTYLYTPGFTDVVLVSDAADIDFRYQVVHEFGHVLGFAHEQERPDNWSGGMAQYCNTGVSMPGGQYETSYFDTLSIMSYCAYPQYTLSHGDMYGARNLYGAPSWHGVGGFTSSVGSGWVVGTTSVGNGDFGVYQWSPNGQTWLQAQSPGAQKISVDLNGAPWLIDHNGRIFKWVLDPIDPAHAVYLPALPVCSATSVASGSADNETWATDCGNRIWNWTGSAWRQASGAGLKVAVFTVKNADCLDHLPVIIGTDSGLYVGKHVPNDCAAIPTWSDRNGWANDITTDFIVGTNGTIYHWDQLHTTWEPYSAAPFGASTRIGGSTLGFFAANASGSMQQINTGR